MCDGEISLLPGQERQDSAIPRDTWNQAVSVRRRWKNHEIQTEVHSESNNSLNVCPAVEDEMDEEGMEDKVEQSEESRGVRVGQKKMMTPTLADTNIGRTGGTWTDTYSSSKLVQTFCSCTGKQPCSPRSKVCNGGRG